MIGSDEGGNSGGTTQTTYTREELEDMTISAITAIAAERGYTITATLKDDIIDEFLTQQG